MMDIEEDKDIPLKHGRPFMKTTRVVIDIDEGKLKVRAQNDKVIFNIFDGLKYSNAWKNCLQTNATKEVFLKLKSN